ncbi:MAG: hypothetical protein V1725_06705 [archaeon]
MDLTEQFIADMNRVWKNPPQRRDAHTIDLHIFFDKSVFPQNLTQEEYAEGISDTEKTFHTIFDWYARKLNLALEPTFRVWEYDHQFKKALSTLQDEIAKTEHDQKAMRELIREYEMREPHKRRGLDLVAVYEKECASLTRPAIYCALFEDINRPIVDNIEIQGNIEDVPRIIQTLLNSLRQITIYPTSTIKGSVQHIGYPLMIVSTKEKRFKNVFKHELNHCLGAGHSLLPYTIMNKSVDVTRDYCPLLTLRRMRHTIKETYATPRIINLMTGQV